MLALTPDYSQWSVVLRLGMGVWEGMGAFGSQAASSAQGSRRFLLSPLRFLSALRAHSPGLSTAAPAGPRLSGSTHKGTPVERAFVQFLTPQISLTGEGGTAWLNPAS